MSGNLLVRFSHFNVCSGATQLLATALETTNYLSLYEDVFQLDMVMPALKFWQVSCRILLGEIPELATLLKGKVALYTKLSHTFLEFLAPKTVAVKVLVLMSKTLCVSWLYPNDLIVSIGKRLICCNDEIIFSDLGLLDYFDGAIDIFIQHFNVLLLYLGSIDDAIVLLLQAFF